METPEQRNPTEPVLSKLSNARVFLQCREEIIQLWSERVRKEIPIAKELRAPIIINTIPVFLENMAEALDPSYPRDYATDTATVAMEHGGERARVARFNPEHLIQEYHLLRDSIFEITSKKMQLTKRETNVIQKSIDKALIESMNSYFLVLTNIREQFTASLTHDLRSPIGVARMSAEIIQMEIDNKNEVLALTEKIIKNMKRADRMIQGMLDASILRGGESLTLNLAEVDFDHLVREIIADLNENQRSLIHLEGTEAARGFLDADALSRAIENLITNAFKYGDPNSLITIKFGIQYQRIHFSIHNNGPSIPPDEQEILFQSFRRSFTAKRSGKKGWGLGLALVRAVAEAHGGSIAVDSSPERGTTFILDLPQDARPFQKPS